MAKVDRSKHVVKERTLVSSGSIQLDPMLITSVNTFAIFPRGLPTTVNPPKIQVAEITEEGDAFSERFDVYNNPEKFGLEQVAKIDYSNGDYCFDYRIVWRHTKTALLYTARDSGCSCPSPFEEYTSLKTLARFSLSEIEEEVLTERKADHYCGDNPTPFLEAVRDLVPTTYPSVPRRVLGVEG